MHNNKLTIYSVSRTNLFQVKRFSETIFNPLILSEIKELMYKKRISFDEIDIDDKFYFREEDLIENLLLIRSQKS